MSNDEIMERQIRAVEKMTMPELNEKFKELFGVPAPNTNGKCLRARLIYRLQEIYLGGISAEDFARLEKLADRDPMANLKRDLTRNLRNGAKLQRLWKGVMHEVSAVGDGTYEYDGAVYKSLSAVARLITGTRWNGKLFFGVK